MVKIRENLSHLLGDDEKIIWAGKSKKVSFLDNTNKMKNIIKVLFCQAVAISFGMYAVENSTKSVIPTIVIMTLIFELVAFYDYLSIIKLRKVNYYLTSKKIISEFSEDDIKILELCDIKDYFYGIDKDENESLVLGKSCPMWIWRNRANGPFVFNKKGFCIKGCVYALEDFDSFKKYFEAQLNK